MRLIFSSANEMMLAFQRSPSEFNPLVSFSARTRRFAVVSLSCCRRFFSPRVSSQVFCSTATFSMTAASCDCFSFSAAVVAASCVFISSRRAFLGPTSFATSEYTSIARTHRHSPSPALDTFCTTSGCISSIGRYCLRSFFSLASAMLSLSYPVSRSMKSDRLSTFFALSHDSFSPSITQTASITMRTAVGGLVNDFTSVMSALVKLFSALTALSSAGSARSRSFCASSATACVSAACLPTMASSAPTLSATIFASALSLATCARSTSVSLAFALSTGPSFTSSPRKPSTTALVSFNLRTPTFMRSLLSSTTSCKPLSMLMYRLMRSRYDLGVVYTLRRSSLKNLTLMRSMERWT